MEHYYQFCISVRPLSNLSTMYPLYSATLFLPEITPFDSERILKTEVGKRFVNGCLKFSQLSNTRVEYVATCCRIGSDNRVSFFCHLPNIPLL